MLENIKKFVIWVLAPVAFVFGFIYYLLHKNDELEAKLNDERANRELEKITDKLDEAGRTADEKEAKFNDSYSDFNAALEKYSKRRGDDMPD